MPLVMLFFLHLIIQTRCTGPVMYRGQDRLPFKDQSRIRSAARSYIGTPYRYGGSSRRGMDCSGLVVRVYRDVFDTRLPHRVARLVDKGKAVSRRDLQTGDLLFFRLSASGRIDHVGIYIERGRFVHASSSRGVVEDSLDNELYRKTFAGARRMYGS